MFRGVLAVRNASKSVFCHISHQNPNLRRRAAISGSVLAILAVSQHKHFNRVYCASAALLESKQIKEATKPAAEVKKAEVILQKVEENATSWLEYLQNCVYSLTKYVKTWVRMMYCTTVVSSVAWFAPGILFFKDKEALYAYIVYCIELLGPTFIKLAQWASSRPDLFP